MSLSKSMIEDAQSAGKAGADRKPWSDPVCHEVSVADVTQFNIGPGFDGDVVAS